MSICNFDQCCICVFVYLCICICVFASQTPRNIVSEVLLPLPFQKYSTCHVYLQLWPMLYLRICVFVYLQVRHPGILFLRSLYHHLSENIWFVWSKTSSGDKRRCHQAGRRRQTTMEDSASQPLGCWKAEFCNIQSIDKISARFDGSAELILHKTAGLVEKAYLLFSI